MHPELASLSVSFPGLWTVAEIATLQTLQTLHIKFFTRLALYHPDINSAAGMFGITFPSTFLWACHESITLMVSCIANLLVLGLRGQIFQ